MPRFEEPIEARVRGLMQLHAMLADPNLNPDLRGFANNTVVNADTYLSEHTDELIAERARLLELNDVYAMAVADYITLLLKRYDDAAQATAGVLAKALIDHQPALQKSGRIKKEGLS
jgi:hypothetical protein